MWEHAIKMWEDAIKMWEHVMKWRLHGFTDAEQQAPLYLHTTEEMLKCLEHEDGIKIRWTVQR